MNTIVLREKEDSFVVKYNILGILIVFTSMCYGQALQKLFEAPCLARVDKTRHFQLA